MWFAPPPRARRKIAPLPSISRSRSQSLGSDGGLGLEKGEDQKDTIQTHILASFRSSRW